MLLTLVFVYLFFTIIIGLYAARRVKNTADYAIAGRNLPMVMIVTTTFATWFGSETVLGIPAQFVSGGLHGIIEDPFGAGFCLILVGLFFARKLYRMTLLTISDYYRERYGQTVEIACTLIIMLSYLGWVAAQVTALGMVFNLLSGGSISEPLGMTIGVFSILAYTLFGGMWSVAVTDFIQMIILVLGLTIIAFVAGDMAGGADKVIAYATSHDLFRFFPKPEFKEIVFFFAASITIMLGSIPQQDVFQRVMSANNVRSATRGPVIGGIAYILFAFVPIFLVTSSLIIMPEQTATMLGSKKETQHVLPTLVLEKMPFVMQVIFFGALLSAIKSTASATLLAPSVTFTENIWRQFRPARSDRDNLKVMRITVLLFSLAVLIYAIRMNGSSIYDMVSGAYQVPLVGAFVPLVCGLYWQRATTQGALAAVTLGIGVWLLFVFLPWGEAPKPPEQSPSATAVSQEVTQDATQAYEKSLDEVIHNIRNNTAPTTQPTPPVPNPLTEPPTSATPSAEPADTQKATDEPEQPTLGDAFPAQLAGVLASLLGMIAGSLLPQWLRNKRTPHRPFAGDEVKVAA